MDNLVIVTVDAQPEGMVWVCENRALAWRVLSEYVAERWRRAWGEEPESFGEDEVRRYFESLAGLASFSITPQVKPTLGQGRFLSYAADWAIAGSSTAALFHIIAECVQGRTDNMVTYLAYVALSMLARFGSRIIGGSK